MDKDNKMHQGQLTLQQVMELVEQVKGHSSYFDGVLQVVGGGGLVVSPIQLVTSTQGLKFIGQPNGVTTIELSTPHSEFP